MPEQASTMSWELYKNSDGYSIRVVLNEEPIDFCKLGNKSANFLCPIDKFKARIASLSNHKFKKQCGMHLKYKMPELKHEGNSTLVPNIILTIMVILTITFSLLGWSIRKRYKHLDAMINRELGDAERRNQ